MVSSPDSSHIILSVVNFRYIVCFQNNQILFSILFQRATSELDKSRQPVDPLSINLIRLKESHRGILTTNYTAATRDLTSHLDSFRPQPSTGYRDRGEQHIFS